MTISTVLLSQDNYYLWPNWELPKRFKGDKEFITALSKWKRVLMSPNTYKDMPKSILNNCTPVFEWEYDINFGIASFKELSDVFIVIRSKECLWGWKAFKKDYFDSYNKVMDINWVEMYLLK